MIILSSHPHIIDIIGWTTIDLKLAFLTELANTDLHKYITSFKDETLPLSKIYSILWQISRALEHIASLLMVHRDVACRNVLLIGTHTAKLADFGLCCYCDENLTYEDGWHKSFPIRFLAIEAVTNHMFSEKSDVWSFGILCYEVFTFGETPCPSTVINEIIDFWQILKLKRYFVRLPCIFDQFFNEIQKFEVFLVEML